MRSLRISVAVSSVSGHWCSGPHLVLPRPTSSMSSSLRSISKLRSQLQQLLTMNPDCPWPILQPPVAPPSPSADEGVATDPVRARQCRLPSMPSSNLEDLKTAFDSRPDLVETWHAVHCTQPGMNSKGVCAELHCNSRASEWPTSASFQLTRSFNECLKFDPTRHVVCIAVLKVWNSVPDMYDGDLMMVIYCEFFS